MLTKKERIERLEECLGIGDTFDAYMPSGGMRGLKGIVGGGLRDANDLEISICAVIKAICNYLDIKIVQIPGKIEAIQKKGKE